jgi:hypothetical protein
MDGMKKLTFIVSGDPGKKYSLGLFSFSHRVVQAA